MSMTMTSIVAAAEQLSSADRIRLVEHVLATLDKPAPEIDAAWRKNIDTQKRANGGIDDHLRGETKGGRRAPEPMCSAQYLRCKTVGKLREDKM